MANIEYQLIAKYFQTKIENSNIDSRKNSRVHEARKHSRSSQD